MKNRIIVVARIADGELADSKPCHDCVKIMRRYKIHKVYYSVPGGFVVEKVSTLSNDKITYGNKLARNL